MFVWPICHYSRLCFVYHTSLITVEVTHSYCTTQNHHSHASKNFVTFCKMCFIYRNMVQFLALIMSWCTINVYTFRTSSPHGGNCVPDHCLFNIVPFLQEGCCKSLNTWYGWIMIPDPSPQYSPNVFNRIKVRRHRWPLETLNFIVFQKGRDDPGSVWACISVHEKKPIT